jgi:hypothetical protein
MTDPGGTDEQKHYPKVLEPASPPDAARTRLRPMNQRRKRG